MKNELNQIEFILYVSDQIRSRDFYKKVLKLEPSLDVEGMTEFMLDENCKIGLMPENGIAKILDGRTKNPSEGNGIPRCELYLSVDNIEQYFQRALDAGGIEISSIQLREWGDMAGYISDPDGHVIAFAKSNS